MDSRLAIRGGYGFRPSTLPTPGSTTMLGNDGVTPVTNVATLLDSGVHSISLGAGYYFGDRPHERGEPDASAPQPASPPTAAHVLPYDADGFELEPAHPDDAPTLVAVLEVRGDDGDRGAQTRSRTPAPTAPARPPNTAARPAPAPVQPPRPTPVSPTVARTTAPTPAAAAAASPTAAAPAAPMVADVSASDEPDSDLPGITAQISVYFRANLFQERVDTVKDIAYGGSIYDLGVQMSLGWY